MIKLSAWVLKVKLKLKAVGVGAQGRVKAENGTPKRGWQVGTLVHAESGHVFILTS